MCNALGVVAEAMVSGEVWGSVLVLQAGGQEGWKIDLGLLLSLGKEDN